jgi:flagellar hook-length control protein FliK
MHPEELGTVEIRLHYGADGISATVHADNPQAAQTLQQAAPDLRRALEAQGMTLLSLDVGDGKGQEPADPNPSRRNRGGASADDGDENDEIAGVALDPQRLPAAGSQIDVLA